MYKSERQTEIIALLKAEGYTTVEHLSKLLYTSPSSIRRDLIQLEKQGLVTRSYGGVELRKSNAKAITPFFTSVQHRVAEKRIIAEKAASLVQDKDIIFLDHSSTALFLAQELIKTKSITIMTNSIEVLSAMDTDHRISIYSCGGKVHKTTRCFVGEEATLQFRRLRADIAFFSCDALTADGGIYADSWDDVLIREAMLKYAAKTACLCDSEKFGKSAGYNQCWLQDVDYLISNVDCRQNYQSISKDLIIL